MSDDLQVRVRTDPRLLCSVRWLVRGYLQGFGYSPERTEEVVLAVDEACANSIRHSYAGNHHALLVLSFRALERWIEIELEDTGTPVAIEKTRAPKAEHIERERLTPGGLGMYLIHRAFDEVLYDPGTERGNRVRLRLNRTQSTGT
ncbi:MAG: ATP-binding protein [Candidatus Hydrogenedentes bacterium]|nr:ATP-binding protein [Candidatus Hydrogenedentota bacterium]MBI3119116.1 ATP-binding protein [Candidatus Hydrogenedentota bacterium]